MHRTNWDLGYQAIMAVLIWANVWVATGDINYGAAAFCFCVLIIVKD